jgi:hypothetical protein
MRDMIRAVAIGVSALAAWFVAASYLFVALGRLDIDQPWRAWWLYATGQPDTWTLLLLTVSAIIPLFVAGGALTAVWRLIGTRLRRPLYGNSAWATDAEMRACGIRPQGTLF